MFATATSDFTSLLKMGQKRYIHDTPSAIKMYHSLSSLIMKDTRERREKLTDELMDPKGKWKPSSTKWPSDLYTRSAGEALE